jgi:hypothetical protein
VVSRVQRRSATALAVGVVVPAIAGLIVTLAADAVIAAGGGDAQVMEQLSTLVRCSAVVVVAASLATFVAAVVIVRLPTLAAALLAQPVVVFAGMRVVGTGVLAGALLWPSLRQPLVGVAVAFIDAAFVASALLLVAPLLEAAAGRVAVIAAVYVGYRFLFALTPFLSDAWQAEAWLAHRLVSVVVVGCVAGVFVVLARRAPS